MKWPSQQRFLKVAEATLRWSRDRDYVDLGEADGLTERLFGRAGVGRSETARTRSPGVIARFATSWLNHLNATGASGSGEQARALLDWLLEQELETGQARSAAAVRVAGALISGSEILGDTAYLEGALGVVEAEPAEDAEPPTRAALGALLAKVGQASDQPALVARGSEAIASALGGDIPHFPPTRHGYRVGEVVEALGDYEKSTKDERFHDAMSDGLDAYRAEWFTHLWRPKWEADTSYPHDYRAFAQGIVTLTRAGDLETARLVADAALEDLWDIEAGHFVESRGRWRTSTRATVETQASMALALTVLAGEMAGTGRAPTGTGAHGA